jgi:hypothetical protein
MTDYKQLCAELVNVLAQYVNLPDDPEAVALLRRARAALAEPEPKQPTVMEIIELADEIEESGLGQVDLVRAALARWGSRNTSRSTFDG